MFVLSKPVILAKSDHVVEVVERSASPVAYDIEETEEGTVYKISSYTPFIRYSMFGPFSEVALERHENVWLLKLRLSKTLLLPFAAAAVAAFIFRTMGPVGPQALALIFGVPLLVVATGLLEAGFRIKGWWRKI